MDIIIYYLHKGDDIPFYIGYTKNSKHRLGHHRKKYGTLTEMVELDLVCNDDKKSIESMYIGLFRSWGFNLINKNDGGGGPLFHNDRTKAKISQWYVDNNHNPRTGNKMSSLSKKRISKALKGKPKPEGFGEMMRSVRQGVPKPKGMGNKVSKNRNHKAVALKQQKKVIQLDLDGNIIKEWDSINIAAEGTNSNPSTISKVCRGIFNQTNGFKWKFKK